MFVERDESKTDSLFFLQLRNPLAKFEMVEVFSTEVESEESSVVSEKLRSRGNCGETSAHEKIEDDASSQKSEKSLEGSTLSKSLEVKMEAISDDKAV